MTAPSGPSRALVAGAVAVAVLSISTAAIAIRLVEDAGAVAIAFHRLALATLILLPFALARADVRRDLARMGRADLARLSLVGFILALHFATWIKSLELTSVASSVVLVTFHPVLVGLVQHFRFGERLGRMAWLGIAVALLGSAIIGFGDAALGRRTLLGDGLALAGAVFAGLYFLAGRRMRQRLSLLAYAVPVYAAATVTLLLLAVAMGERLAGFPQRDYLWFLFLAVVPMIGGHTLLNWSLRYVPAIVVSATVLAEPIGSSVLALFVLAEAPPATTVLGGALILAGIWSVVRRERPRPPAPSAPG